jgi:acetyltransferase-like isoleucine patch superfamily enzyme
MDEELGFRGDGVKIGEGTVLMNAQNIRLRCNVEIRRNAILNGYNGKGIEIGRGSWIGEGCYLHGAGGITIESMVGIGPFVKILTSQHKGDDISKPVMLTELEFEEVKIETGADVGMGSIILPGVTVGGYAIVGAGSVVTKNIEPYAVYAGNPAKFLRKRI